MKDVWAKSDAKLYDATVETLRMFTSEHPGTEVQCLFFDADEPRYGQVSIGIDTSENNTQSVKSLEAHAIKGRKKFLQSDDSWTSAKYRLTSPRLSILNTNSGNFAFPQYLVIEFGEWSKLAKSKTLPVGGEHDDDYMDSNVRLVFYRVTERLIANDAFATLQLASPFVIGYSIHDQDESILRILNW